MTTERRVSLLAGVLLLALAACAPSANEMVGSVRPEGGTAGFLLGLWHGLTVPFMFVWSLFSDSVGIYEMHNTGWPYNLGFVIGVLSGAGGAGAGSRGKRGRD